MKSVTQQTGCVQSDRVPTRKLQKAPRLSNWGLRLSQRRGPQNWIVERDQLIV